MNPRCCYCRTALPCKADSEVLHRYWKTIFGSLTCNDCLLLTRSDCYSDLQGDGRLAALRLRYARQWPYWEKVSGEIEPDYVGIERDDSMSVKVIRAKIDAGRDVIDAVLVRRAERELEEFFELHRRGELLAALLAGRAAWNSTQTIHTMLVLKHEVLTGRRALRQRKSAGFSSGNEREAERRPEWEKWQSLANELFAANPRLSVSAAAQRIAECLHVSPETVRKRIHK